MSSPAETDQYAVRLLNNLLSLKIVMGTKSFVRHLLFYYYHSPRLWKCTFYSVFTTEIDLRDFFTECRCIRSRVMYFGYRYVCSPLFVVHCLELLFEAVLYLIAQTHTVRIGLTDLHSVYWFFFHFLCATFANFLNKWLDRREIGKWTKRRNIIERHDTYFPTLGQRFTNSVGFEFTILLLRFPQKKKKKSENRIDYVLSFRWYC